MVITPTVRGTEAIKIDSADKKNAIAKVAMKSINSTSSAEKAGHRDQPSKKTRF